ncbi:ATP-binding protein [Zafaria sp. J156]|uniref:sensor histidine kinase n=1 Tax=Zafaria sp. J156 TaxID=3116490 RepID=UPI002E761299|nr:ATP-binding protein [Zafaria sp. J156]MEE1621883.1 ATP-binding protein [Zafaria sp. J156]
MGSTARRDRRRTGLRTRLLALQLLIVLGIVTVAATAVVLFEDRRTQETALDTVETVALQLAAQDVVRQHVDQPDAEDAIGPVASLAQAASGVDFVVVVDPQGLRVAHPDPDEVGEPVSTDHGPILAGESFRGTEMGTLGVTLRAKEPVLRDGRVVGTVSVGILQSKIRAELLGVVADVAPWILGAAAIGTVAATWASRTVRRRIYGVEPEDVASLVQSQQAVLFSVTEGVLGVDSTGRLSLVNAEAARLLGIRQEDAGRPAADVLDPHVLGLLDSEGSAAESAQYVLSGERVLLATRREAVSAGVSRGRTLTLRDRTELEATLRELEGQRGLADALRSQTHEFANRLHVIAGYLSAGAPGAAEDYVRRISGALDPSAAHGLADPALSGLLGAQAAVAREAGVALEVDPASYTAEGWSADDDVLTVAANLLSNAIEAAGDGGTVRALIEAGTAGVRVAVEDSGPGIAPGHEARIFQRGYSSKGAEAGTGAPRGVGLALVDRIIARRGGTVEVASSTLGGARIGAAWGGAA